MKNPKVSIIIPVYNVERYLRECLDSIINQTLGNIEIICIDDCSTDKSLDILKEYAVKDNRFSIIEQKENKGQGIARNLGIEQAQGEYLGFIDPDDWIALDMYENMYNQAKKIDSEIVICDFVRHQDKPKKTWIPEIFKRAISASKHEVINMPAGKNIDKNLINETLLVSPCYSVNRIYKRSFIIKHNIKYDIKRCFEDVIFVFKSHYLAQNISYIPSAFYNYRIQQYSTLRAYEERYLDLLNICNDITNYLKECNKYSHFKMNLYYFAYNVTYWTCYRMKNKKYKKKLLKHIRKYLDFKSYIALRKSLSQKKSFRAIFSVTNEGKHKIINILGIKIKYKRYKVN